MTVSDSYTGLTDLLQGMGLATDIWPVPVELPDAIPFTSDTTHRSYDSSAVTAFWRTLVEVERVFNEFRTRFVGKSSPVHLFWGALTWPPPDSPDAPRHRTRAACRTVAPT